MDRMLRESKLDEGGGPPTWLQTVHEGDVTSQLKEALDGNYRSHHVCAHAAAPKHFVSFANVGSQHLPFVDAPKPPALMDLPWWRAATPHGRRPTDVPAAENWLIEMRKRGVQPDHVSYSTVIHACFGTQDVDRAVYWLNEMEKQGEAPNGFCHGSVIRLLAHAHHVERAAGLLHRALAHGIEVEASCFRSVLAACIQAGDLEEAEKWHYIMMDYGMSTNCGGLAAAWIKQGNPARADALYRRQPITNL